VTESSPAQLSFGRPPEYYSDSLRIQGGVYGFMFSFGLQSDGTSGDAVTQAIVRMSPQHAVVMFQLLKKNLRAYQKQVGTISLPDQLFADLELDKDI
jgi:hypothetical protein